MASGLNSAHSNSYGSQLWVAGCNLGGVNAIWEAGRLIMTRMGVFSMGAGWLSVLRLLLVGDHACAGCGGDWAIYAAACMQV